MRRRLQKQLGIGDYETACVLLHKFRAAMARLAPDPIGADWPTVMDISFVGGKHKGGGSGQTHKPPALIAIEVRRGARHAPQTGKLVERALAGRTRLRPVQNKTAAVVEAFAKDGIAPGAMNQTDERGEFEPLRTSGYQHQPLPMRGDRSGMDGQRVHVPLQAPLLSRPVPKDTVRTRLGPPRSRLPQPLSLRLNRPPNPALRRWLWEEPIGRKEESRGFLGISS